MVSTDLLHAYYAYVFPTVICAMAKRKVLKDWENRSLFLFLYANSDGEDEDVSKVEEDDKGDDDAEMIDVSDSGEQEEKFSPNRRYGVPPFIGACMQCYWPDMNIAIDEAIK